MRISGPSNFTVITTTENKVLLFQGKIEALIIIELAFNKIVEDKLIRMLPYRIGDETTISVPPHGRVSISLECYDIEQGTFDYQAKL
jgi:hypothetical protein